MFNHLEQQKIHWSGSQEKRCWLCSWRVQTQIMKVTERKTTELILEDREGERQQ